MPKQGQPGLHSGTLKKGRKRIEERRMEERRRERKGRRKRGGREEGIEAPFAFWRLCPLSVLHEMPFLLYSTPMSLPLLSHFFIFE